MRSLPLSCVLLGSLLTAQEPSAPPPSPAPVARAGTDALAAAKLRLQQALQKTAGIADTAFTAQWGPDTDAKNAAQQFAVAPVGAAKVIGSWHPQLLHVAFEGEKVDQIATSGRRTIAKTGDSEWKLRRGRFADGNPAAFVPDPALLLQQLAAMDLTVKRAAVGTLDDRPIEILTVELRAEQVAEGTWSGALPESSAWSFPGIVQFAFAQAGAAGARPAAAVPDATVDVAVCLDPATDLVHELRFRSWSKANNAMGGRFVVAGGNGGVVRLGGRAVQQEQNDDDDTVPKETGVVDGSVLDERGLPVRSRKDTSVTDFTIRLREHGKKGAPALSDAQKQLLGL